MVANLIQRLGSAPCGQPVAPDRRPSWLQLKAELFLDRREKCRGVPAVAFRSPLQINIVLPRQSCAVNHWITCNAGQSSGKRLYRYRLTGNSAPHNLKRHMLPAHLFDTLAVRLLCFLFMGRHNEAATTRQSMSNLVAEMRASDLNVIGREKHLIE